MTDTIVTAHLVQITWKSEVSTKNPCSEIVLPTVALMQPKHITMLRLQGVDVFDVTESLDMEGSRVYATGCYQL